MAQVSERLTTGIPRIDNEHLLLADLIAWIEEVCAIANARDCSGCILAVRDKCAGNLDVALKSLASYMTNHFRYEERLMNWAVPKDHVEEHQAAHRFIEKRLMDLLRDYSRDGNSADVARRVVTELRAWLDGHFETLDAVLAVHIGSEDHR